MATCGWFFDWRSSARSAPVICIVVGWGQHSLSIYYLQLVGIVGSAVVLRALTGSTIRVDWQWFALLFVLALLIVYFIVNVVWSRFDYILSLEWFFKKLVLISDKAVQGNRQVAKP